MEERQTQASTAPGLHRLLAVAFVALVAWFIAAVWSGFAADGYADWLLVVVTVFTVIAGGIPWLLWRTWIRNRESDGVPPPCGPLRKWLAADVDTAAGPMRSREAAVQVLLPMAATAVGMTAFGIIFHLAAHGAL